MTIKVLKHQADFIKSDVRHTGIVGGYRSGKSQAGVYKTLAKKQAMPGIDVAYYLPTYRLIRDMAFEKFEDLLTSQNIPYTINKSSSDILTEWGKIILRSMENPESIIAYEVGYSLVDECDLIGLNKMIEVNKRILSRNSVKSDLTNNATDYVSTPEGFNFMYNFFAKDLNNPNKKLIKASTIDNPFISEDYIKSLEDSYSEKELMAYLDGDFVNLSSGNVYYVFDREIHHSPREIKEHDVLHIGMDFNITNMSAVVRVLDGNVSTAVEEITGAYDTAEMIRIIKERFSNHRIVIYPDASSNARNTAGVSDMQLLKEARFVVRSNNSNPRVRDRVSVVNNSFEKMFSFVNTHKCPSLTEAYEQLGYKNGEPDKTTGFDHITDADGYVVHSLHFKSRPRVSFQLGGGNLL